jgi:predicted RNase H-like HicB family nuclease
MRHGAGGATLQSTFEFTVEVEPDECDGGFIAECVQLPGCMAQGETEEEALTNIVDAITAVLEVKMQDQLKSPEFEIRSPDVKIRKVSLA